MLSSSLKKEINPPTGSLKFPVTLVQQILS